MTTIDRDPNDLISREEAIDIVRDVFLQEGLNAGLGPVLDLAVKALPALPAIPLDDRLARARYWVADHQMGNNLNGNASEILEILASAEKCENCGKPIHYEADLQSWRHDDDGYDRCHGLPGKQFAGPSSALPVLETPAPRDFFGVPWDQAPFVIMARIATALGVVDGEYENLVVDGPEELETVARRVKEKADSAGAPVEPVPANTKWRCCCGAMNHEGTTRNFAAGKDHVWRHRQETCERICDASFRVNDNWFRCTRSYGHDGVCGSSDEPRGVEPIPPSDTDIQNDLAVPAPRFAKGDLIRYYSGGEWGDRTWRVLIFSKQSERYALRDDRDGETWLATEAELSHYRLLLPAPRLEDE